jgi:Protein of unknown function (DUF998)
MEPGAFALALVSVVGSLTYLGAVAVLHALPTGYDPIQHAVSDYGVGKYSPVFRIGLWASAVGVVALAIGLGEGVGSPPLAIRGPIYLGLAAFCRIGESLYPTDVEGQKSTRTGVLHYVFAILTFAFTYAAISNLTPALVKLHPWASAKGVLDVLNWIVLIALILVVAALLLPRLRRHFGLWERVFLLASYIWLVLVALLLAVKTV